MTFTSQMKQKIFCWNAFK